MRWIAAALLLLVPRLASAADKNADPSSYQSMLATLAPGDTLHLAAGTYHLLPLANLNGDTAHPITITGPSSGAPAIIQADTGPCCNTIEISNSSFLVVRNLTVDGLHVAGAFGVSAASGSVHDITIEGCTFVNHDGDQQTDAISTKTPTWGWVIRRNSIVGVGTGLYLGNSDGSDPFVGGLIEDNLVQNPIGYCMEIKFQQPRPTNVGLPTNPTTTIIRNNVFIKNDAPSPDGDRPNLLVGGFPASGPGSMDRYEIYGNFFFHNPRESLLQVSGRVTIHDNVFVDVTGTAILAQDHDLPLELAYVYNNTIYAAGSGIHFGSLARQGDAVAGNLVFAATPIGGTIGTQRDNVTDAVANAAQYVNAPSVMLGQMDFYPRAGSAAKGTALDLSTFAPDTDFDRDFNGTPKGSPALYRGAYAGEGTNPGWMLGASIKQGGGASPPDGGSGSGGASGSGTGGAGGGVAGGDSGCGCHLAPGNDSGVAWILILAAVVRRRRAHRS